ncbi:MAG: hypothetical protein Q8T11_13965 [Elusimicrobiota bacterium]|nr:hypothetical protein [Elusimicrobiota bacterium]
MSGLSQSPDGASVIAKLMMPWLFVGRNPGWTPYAKVRRDGPAARPRRKVRRPAVRPS